MAKGQRRGWGCSWSGSGYPVGLELIPARTGSRRQQLLGRRRQQRGRRSQRELVRHAALALVLGSLIASAAQDVPARPDRYATDQAGVVGGAAVLCLLNQPSLCSSSARRRTRCSVYVARRLPDRAHRRDLRDNRLQGVEGRPEGQGQRGLSSSCSSTIGRCASRSATVSRGRCRTSAPPAARRHRGPRAARKAASSGRAIWRAEGRPPRNKADTRGARRALPRHGTHAGRGGGGRRHRFVFLVLVGSSLVAPAAAFGNAPGASAMDRRLRAGVAGGIVAVLLSLGATFIVKDGRFVVSGVRSPSVRWCSCRCSGASRCAKTSACGRPHGAPSDAGSRSPAAAS